MKGSRLRAVLPLTALLIAVASARPAFAQTDAVAPVPADRPEELEPRAVSALLPEDRHDVVHRPRRPDSEHIRRGQGRDIGELCRS